MNHTIHDAPAAQHHRRWPTVNCRSSVCAKTHELHDELAGQDQVCGLFCIHDPGERNLCVFECTATSNTPVRAYESRQPRGRSEMKRRETAINTLCEPFSGWCVLRFVCDAFHCIWCKRSFHSNSINETNWKNPRKWNSMPVVGATPFHSYQKQKRGNKTEKWNRFVFASVLLAHCSSLSRIHRSMHFFEESIFSFVGRLLDRRCVCAHFYQLEFLEGNGLMGGGSFEEKFPLFPLIHCHLKS